MMREKGAELFDSAINGSFDLVKCLKDAQEAYTDIKELVEGVKDKSANEILESIEKLVPLVGSLENDCGFKSLISTKEKKEDTLGLNTHCLDDAKDLYLRLQDLVARVMSGDFDTIRE